jgi:large subunit ribosomal protein L2
MAIKYYRPTTPGRRGMTTQDFDAVTGTKSKKSLLVMKKGATGRNNQGRITVRHRGGGVKRYYRLINFKPNNFKGVIKEIEYDPNRSARIALIEDENSGFHYVLALNGMKVGQKVVFGDGAPIEVGNRMKLKDMPTGSTISNIELNPNKGAQLVRSAGASAQLTAKEGEYAQVKLPSGEVRMIDLNCYAVIGSIGNEQHQNIKIGKAGRNRLKGKRPTVRGVVMNAADHPHGGGDGGRHGPGKDPRTPWGQKTLGYKTRSRKSTNKFIIRSRHASKRR